MQEELANANNLWVFRDGKVATPGSVLHRELSQAVASLFSSHPTTRITIDALLRAGEFESALADSGPDPIPSIERLTDRLAHCLWDENSEALSRLPESLEDLQQISVPNTLRVSPTEGFAYYALHPLDVARFADHVAQDYPSAAVVGIRSIGTTLSAIVLAALERGGRRADRITIRPTGHPYARVTQFTAEQLRWVEARLAAGAKFLVVDEGPGRSGSSFLSVAEALESAGVPVDRILLIGSRPIDPADLCAADAPSRWRRFRFVWPQSTMYARFHEDIYIGGGLWREALSNMPAQHWPCCWPQMERFKFLSSDRKWIYKFDGFGRFGEDVLQRSQRIADAGLGPPAEHAGDGMIRTPRVQGEILDRNCVSRTVLDRIADYCAFRANEFPARNAPASQLQDMVRFNVQQEFGVEPDLALSPLSPTHLIVDDGRMQPHEWVIGSDGKLMKFDACTHGDDHFFPGPTDIAWDLAGTVVEWRLDKDATEFLLSRYYQLTGDSVGSRLAPFLLAYSVFRMGYCKMALSSVLGTSEYARLQRAAEHYRQFAHGILRQTGHAHAAQKIRHTSVSPAASLENQAGPAA